MRRLVFFLALALVLTGPAYAANVTLTDADSATQVGTPARPLAGSAIIGITSGGFTTPAGTTAYAVGDLIADSATAGSVTPVPLAVARITDSSVILRRVRVKTPDTGFANQSVRIHIYKDVPTPTNGDNGVWLTTESSEVCELDVTLNRHFTDFEKGIGVPNEGTECNITPAAGTQNVYALIEARSAATPQGAKAWTIVLESWNN